jgi:hypothetical protein
MGMSLSNYSGAAIGKATVVWIALLAAPGEARAQAGSVSAPFSLVSPNLMVGDFLSTVNASSANDCGGQNVSPPLQWFNVPTGTRSFAVVMFNPDGSNGAGVTHWIAYDIPDSITTLREGASNGFFPALVGGLNSNGTTLYSGPCPPAGEQPYRYVVTIYALDLAREALKAGLDRDAFLDAVRNHTLAEASIVLHYQR